MSVPATKLHRVLTVNYQGRKEMFLLPSIQARENNKTTLNGTACVQQKTESFTEEDRKKDCRY